eukprot:gene6698-7790_t
MSTIIYFGWFRLFILYWAVPFATTTNIIGSLIELVEHYPLLELRPGKRQALYLSRNRISNNIVINFLLSMHQENWHLVHHLFPKIPFWNQKEAHQLLMTIPEYSNVHTTVGWTSMVKKMFEDADLPFNI